MGGDYKLTPREREILQAICDFGGDHYAAEELGISKQTVKNTTLKIRKKMDLKTTLQVIYVLMLEDGYIEKHDDE